MESLKTCNVCYVSFDAKVRTPRFLPCGHTICSNCLQSILTNPILRKCPFDNIPFAPSRKSLATFPINFLVLEMLEQKNNDLCKTHLGEKLKYICLTDKMKICSECAKHPKHLAHKMKKINELKSEGVKLKGKLQESLLKIKQQEQDQEQSFEQTRKVFIKTIDDQFKEIKAILVEKRLELLQQATKLFAFNKNLDSKRLLKLKQEMDEKLKNINQTCNEDDGDMMLLEKAINDEQIEGRIKPQLLKEKSLKVHNKFLDMQSTLTDSLKIFKSGINFLELSNQEVVKEMCSGNGEDLSQEALAEMHKKLRSVGFKSYFDVTNHENYLKISTKDDNLKEVEIDFDEFKEHEKVLIKLARYDTLLKEPNKNLLSYLLRRLENFAVLEVLFNSKDLKKNESLFWVANTIQDHCRGLKNLYLRFEDCKFNDQFMQVLCDNIISKVPNLELIGFNFNSCKLRDKDLKILVKALGSSQKELQTLTIKLDNTDVTDDGVCELLRMIPSNLHNLFLSLKGTKITDKSLEMLGTRVLPNLKELSSLRFYIDSNKFSETGIWTVFKNLKNLTKLDLDFSSISISDELMLSLLEEVIPKLDCLELFNFSALGREIKEANFVKIHKLVKLLNPFHVQKIETEEDHQLLCKEQITQVCN